MGKVVAIKDRIRLREYQQLASKNALATKRKKPLIVLPTGSGKSIVCKALTKPYRSVLILVPSKELVNQNADKLDVKCQRWYTNGIYNNSTVIVSTFASAVSKKERLLKLKFDLVIVDEAHRVCRANQIGKLIDKLDTTKVVGLTATPYRLTHNGLIYGDNQFQFFDECCYKATRNELIAEGYLSQRIFKDTVSTLIGEGVTKKSTGDYQTSELSDKVKDKSLDCLDKLDIDKFENALIFTVDVKHAQRVAKHLNTPYITGETKAKDRKKILEDFQKGLVKILISVETLTTGFDYPNLRNIIILRPTQSRVLYEQILGRGDRLKDNGENYCNIYDFTDNFYRFVVDYDMKQNSKSSNSIVECPKCDNMVNKSVHADCPHCGHELRKYLGMDAPTKECPNCGHENSSRKTYCDSCGEFLRKESYRSTSKNYLSLTSLKLIKATKDNGWQIKINGNPRYILDFTHKEVKANPFRCSPVPKLILDKILSKKGKYTATFNTGDWRIYVSRNMEGNLNLERIELI